MTFTTKIWNVLKVYTYIYNIYVGNFQIYLTVTVWIIPFECFQSKKTLIKYFFFISSLVILCAKKIEKT